MVGAVKREDSTHPHGVGQQAREDWPYSPWWRPASDAARQGCPAHLEGGTWSSANASTQTLWFKREFKFTVGALSAAVICRRRCHPLCGDQLSWIEWFQTFEIEGPPEIDAMEASINFGVIRNSNLNSLCHVTVSRGGFLTCERNDSRAFL